MIWGIIETLAGCLIALYAYEYVNLLKERWLRGEKVFRKPQIRKYNSW